VGTLLAEELPPLEKIMTDKTADAFIERDFSDAGTDEKFTGGKIQPISEGAFLNYKAAGLVREPTDEEMKAAKATKPTNETKSDPKKD